jgi:ATP-dependent phosphofructokinase / diphosphate-dependent phosphofructokinase
MNTHGRNVLVAQSGGPSPVINASLQGVIDCCRDHGPRFGSIFAGRNGIEGILQEDLLRIDAEDPRELQRLRHTPGAGAIGTCRYKLGDDNREDFDRLIEVIRAHEIGYFFYNGGNDSMDTASRVAALARDAGIELLVVGVPKTIDNDVGDPEFALVDHTPGYGSTARYWASITQIVNEENRGMWPSEPVNVVQAMGRAAGFIPAAARLGDPRREMPLQIYMAESGYTLPAMADFVADEVRRSGRCIVVVSEGFDLGHDDSGAEAVNAVRDAFGHVEYGAGRSSAAQEVVNYLNSSGLPARGNATGQVPGVLQRSTSVFASTVDREEAYLVGRHAVDLAARGVSGVMAALQRAGGGLAAASTPYEMKLGDVPLEQVANFHRTMPDAWVDPDRPDVTDEFVAWARPLIGTGWSETEVDPDTGVHRFAQLQRIPVDKILPPYRPMGHR